MPQGTPLFETLYAFENFPHGAPSEPDESLRIRDITGHNRTHYPLLLLVLPGERLELRLAYAADRFGSEAIGRLEGSAEANAEIEAAGLRRRRADLEDELLAMMQQTARV